ncbi:MAG TPA: ferritin family protein [Myxococcaceae bacterium]|nr:ferritin family protein [Myxococcaceae bacterium]
MPQTPPFTHLTPDRKLTDSELARVIRLSLESEMDAINLYASYIDATDNVAAKRILDHVMDEEREHAALFWQLIMMLDPSQAGHHAEAAEKFRLIVSGASHEEVEAVEAGERSDDVAFVPPGLTVGKMR